jgi:hypothetical protein
MSLTLVKTEEYNKYFDERNGNPNENFLFNIVLNDYRTYNSYVSNLKTFIDILRAIYRQNGYEDIHATELSFYQIQCISILEISQDLHLLV